MRTVTETGRIDRVIRDRCVVPYLDGGTALVAPLVGKSIQETRLALLSLNYLIARFAINGPKELADTLGGDLEPKAAETAVEDYLVHAARVLLAVPPA